MDVASLIVVIVVEAGSLGDAPTNAMTRTVQEMLEGRAIVMVREAAREGLNDTGASSLAGALHADAVAVVSWSSPEHARANVHVLRARDASWVDRAMDFRAADPAEERGRMLGFQIASMVPEERAATGAPTPPARGAEAAGEPAAREGRRPFMSIDVAALAATGFGGAAGGIGVQPAVRVWLRDALAVRAAAGFRIGSMPSAHASTTVTSLALGAAVRAFSTTGAHPFTAGVRVDLLALRHAVTSDLTASSGARWVAGVDAAAEAAWAVSPSFDVVGAIGVEVAAGTTRVFVDQQAVEEIPAFRGLAELGARVSF